MKSINKSIVIASLVLGLGTTNITLAAEKTIEGSVNQVIIEQSEQVKSQLAEQLKQSIDLSLRQMRVANIAPLTTNDMQPMVAKNSLRLTKNELLTEDE